MGVARKYKHYIPEKSSQSDKSSNSEDKKIIEQYVKKIERALEEDPSLSRKAALIIEKMINSKHK